MERGLNSRVEVFLLNEVADKLHDGPTEPSSRSPRVTPDGLPVTRAGRQ